MNPAKTTHPLIAIQAILLTLDRVTPHHPSCQMRETGRGQCTCIVGQIKGAADAVAVHAATLDSLTRALANLYAACPHTDATGRAREQAHAALVEAGYFPNGIEAA
jgi:hypothetical protein